MVLSLFNFYFTYFMFKYKPRQEVELKKIFNLVCGAKTLITCQINYYFMFINYDSYIIWQEAVKRSMYLRIVMVLRRIHVGSILFLHFPENDPHDRSLACINLRCQ
jgi:hypothetical protein